MAKRQLATSLVVAALLTAAALWAWHARPGAEPLPPPGRLTIHGVAPGMPWTEVVALLGHPTSLNSRIGYATWQGGQGFVAVDLEEDLVRSVKGDRLESDGRAWTHAGQEVAPARKALGAPRWRTPQMSGRATIAMECWMYEDAPEVGCRNWQGLNLWVERRVLVVPLTPWTFTQASLGN